MSQQVDLKEFVTGFILEADEHLHLVNQNLVLVDSALKKGKAEPRAIRELFRSLHTIKGLASMVGATPIVDISHEMESILRTADRSGGNLPEKSLDLLLRGTRAIEERVQSISKVGVAAIPKAPAQLIESLVLAQAESSKSNTTYVEIIAPEEILKHLTKSENEQIIQALQDNKRVVLLEYRPSQDKASQGLNITSVRERLGKLGDLVRVIPRSSPSSPTGIAFVILFITLDANNVLTEASGVADDLIEEVSLKTVAPVISESIDPLDELAEIDLTPLDHTSIRVDIRKLDETLERLSELVVTRSKLTIAANELREAGADTRNLNIILAENSRQLKRLRTAITEARMVQLSELLQRLPLIVRGITKDSSKAVTVTVKAGNAEIDKSVADKIMPAIVHLVRNAVDHAIETKEERIKLNKPESGTVLVECDDTSGTHLTLKVSDDGSGIDRKSVARKLGKAVATSDIELLQQITTPGLSTRESVTTTSGRGMGMDIVRRTVELLGGFLNVSSVPDQGTVFTIQVPISVTIVDVMSFVSGNQVYVAPMAIIDEIIEVDLKKISKSPVPSNRGPVPHLLERRGVAVPLLSLSSVLNADSEQKLTNKALVIKMHHGLVAFSVDRMLGSQEVVVRPLEDELVKVSGMAGATDLGDGRPTLVLDLVTIGALVLNNTFEAR